MMFKKITFKKSLVLAAATLIPSSTLFAFGLLQQLHGPQPTWGFINNQAIYSGYMYTRGIFENEDGYKVWVEYSDEGLEVREIGVYNEDDNQDTYYDSYVVAGLTYNGFIDLHDQVLADFEADYGDTLEPTLMTVADYQARKPELVVNNQDQDDWNDNADPALKDATRSVLVYPEAMLITADSPYLLAEFPFDFTDVKDRVDDDIQSVLIDQDGKILEQTGNRIAFRAIYYEDISQAEGDELRFNNAMNYSLAQRTTDEDLELVNPVYGVGVRVPFPMKGGGVTDEGGQFVFRAKGEPCPISYYNWDIQLEAEVPFRAFNPDQPYTYSYYLRKPAFFGCEGRYSISNIPMAVQQYQIDFAIDVNILSGEFVFPGVELVSDTEEIKLEYDFKEPDADPNANPDDPPPSRFTKTAATNLYDFDLDEAYDIAVCGKLEDVTFTDDTGDTETLTAFVPIDEGTTDCSTSDIQGIYLSGYPERPYQCKDENGDAVKGDPNCQPQFTRLVDLEKIDEDIGLVTKMSSKLIQDTDLFIIRQSNGQLIAMRQGLKDAERIYEGSKNDISASVKSAKAGYRMFMRGSDSLTTRNGLDTLWLNQDYTYADWQQDNNINPALTKRRDTDFIRTGEIIEIYAINRVTGYVGKEQVVLGEDALKDGAIFLDTLVPTFEMKPPNLKIWAERKYDIEAGLTKTKPGEDGRKYLIGNEGVGEANDIYIQVYTEWLDEDGTPLPDALTGYGYTGRLAYVSQENKLAEASQTGKARFAIEPGRHTELLRMPGGTVDSLHYYIQVAGVPAAEFEDFALDGSDEQDFRDRSDEATFEELERNLYRPERFVPVLTPQYDEELTEIQWQAFHLEMIERLSEGLETDDLIEPKPYFNWVYRPDYQFSVYDIYINEALVTNAQGQTRDEYFEEHPIIAATDTEFTLDYLFTGSRLETLQELDSDQEFVLALGGQEVIISVNENDTISIENINALSTIESYDYLTAAIYANHDSQNHLWEWAFDYFQIHPDSTDEFNDTTKGYYYIFADDPVLPVYAELTSMVFADDENAEARTIEWSAEGDFEELLETRETKISGLFTNEIRLRPEAWAEATIKATIDDVETEFGPIVVLPGNPDSISFVSSVTDQGVTTLTFRVEDKNNNTVIDGTGIDFQVKGALNEITHDDTTQDGLARIQVQQGNIDDGSAEIIARVESLTERRAITLNTATNTLSDDVIGLLNSQQTQLQNHSEFNELTSTDWADFNNWYSNDLTVNQQWYLQNFIEQAIIDYSRGDQNDFDTPVENAKAKEMLQRLVVAIRGISELSSNPTALDRLSQSIDSWQDVSAWVRWLTIPADGWLIGTPKIPELSDSNCSALPKTIYTESEFSALSVTPCRTTGAKMALWINGIAEGDTELAADPTLLSQFVANYWETLRYSALSLRKMAMDVDPILSTASLGVNPITGEPIVENANAWIQALGVRAAKMALKQSVKSLQNFKHFAQGRSSSRVDTLMLLFAMYYLEDRMNGDTGCSGCKLISPEARSSIRTNINDVIKSIGVTVEFKDTHINQKGQAQCGFAGTYHGSAFEVMALAAHHAAYESDFSEYQIESSNQIFKFPIYKNQKDNTESNHYHTFWRKPDIVLVADIDGKEVRKWVELKSLSVRTANPKSKTTRPETIINRWKHWKFKKPFGLSKKDKKVAKKAAYHRQVVFDALALVDYEKHDDLPDEAYTNEILWYFQDWDPQFKTVKTDKSEVKINTGIPYRSKVDGVYSKSYIEVIAEHMQKVGDSNNQVKEYLQNTVGLPSSADEGKTKEQKENFVIGKLFSSPEKVFKNFNFINFMKENAKWDLTENFVVDDEIRKQLEFWTNNPELAKLQDLLDKANAIDIIPEFELVDDLQQEAVEGVMGEFVDCDL